jgi:hypothetical protein
VRQAEAHFAESQAAWTIRGDTCRLQIRCWLALIAIAILRAWFTRYEFYGDSVSYMDIGRMIAEGETRTAVNAYWSPGYPAVLSLFLWLFHPSAYWECPLAHLVNVLIFAGTLASFQLFWSEVWLWHANYSGIHGMKIPEYVFWVLGYAMFAIVTLSIITVALVGPDMLVAAFCCLAGWAVLRFRRVPSIGRALLLGLVLALGYYAKAPFFPIGFVFLACACCAWPVSQRLVLLGGTALAAFLLVSVPFVTALSLAKGRLTFGDSARLNMGFYINGVRVFQHWQGGPPGAGTPVHATRKLNDSPEIYEFAASNMGTYPPWFDPSYWYEGMTPHFNLKLQGKVFVANMAKELQTIMESGAQLVCAVLILVLLASHRSTWIKGLWRLWFIWLPGIAALMTFALVHVESRFLGGWFVLLFGGAICACWLPAHHGIKRVVEPVGVAVLITTSAALILQTGQEAIALDHLAGRSPRDATVAAFLLNNGLHQGDQVAVIGDGIYTYWAHLAHLRVVAEIPANASSYQRHPAIDFWQSGKKQQAKALALLQGTGTRAVIADPEGSLPMPMASIIPAPWKKIDGTDAYVYFFTTNR